MKIIKLVAIVIFITAIGCDKDNDLQVTEEMVDVGGYELFTLSEGEGENTVVFESGLGNDCSVWLGEKTFQNTSEFAQVIAYNRAGYAPSETGTVPRDLEQLQTDLGEIIELKAQNDKVVLVGHSWGGPIIRAYAVLHPEKVAGIVFIDPSHEELKDFDQSDEDELVNVIGNGLGLAEAEQLLEGIQYISDLPNLPDVPVTVLTGMNNTDMSAEERQNWYDAHEQLGEGVSDFKHIAAENSGHYVMVDEPQLVLDAIREIVEK